MSDISSKVVKLNSGEFSNSQNKAIDLFTTWYNDPDKLIFTLYGAAGTGKTYLIKHLINKVIKHSVCVSAPTHKAVRVIEHMVGRKGRTLQSLHGLRPNFNLDKFNIDNVKFDTIGNNYFANYKIVIIDECSQIGKDLQHLNELRAKQYKTKILYIGDSFQLPPVDGGLLSSTFEVEDKFELLDIVRQEDSNPLLAIFKLLRADIRDNTDNFLKHILKNRTAINDKGEGYLVVNKLQFKEIVKHYFDSPNFFGNVSYCRYAAWTNNNIMQWNNFIRNIVIKNTEEILSKDDLLTGYKTIVTPENFLDPILVNSEDYIIKNIVTRTSDYDINSFATVITCIADGKENTINIINHNDVNSFTNFYRQLNYLHRQALYAKPIDRGAKWVEYFSFKDKHLILTTFPIKDDNFKDGIRAWVTKDLDYGYGLTIHKLQGSTIENIFVNLIDIMKATSYGTSRQQIQLRNKLIYTALSRASKLAIILY